MKKINKLAKSIHPAKLCTFIFILFIIICSCDKDNPTSPKYESRNEGIFPGVGAAKINLGDSYAQIKWIHGNPSEHKYFVSSSGDKYSIYYIRYKDKGITVYFNAEEIAYPEGLKNDDACTEVSVEAPYQGETEKGIKIGSSIADIVAAYGQQAKIVNIGDEIWYDYDSIGLSFGVGSHSTIISIGVIYPK